MTESKHVVVGVDGSDVSWRAVDWAYREAAYRNTVLDIVHITGVEHPLQRWLSDPAPVDGIDNSARDPVLGDVVAHLPELPVNPQVKLIARRVGFSSLSPAPDLIALAQQAQLLVLGAIGVSGMRERLVGSTPMWCAVGASCPVAVVREGPHACREVLVGVDDSAGGYLALEWAAQEADRRGVALHAVHVLRPHPESSDPEDEALQSAHRMLRSNLDKLPETESGHGLVAVAEVVVGRHPAEVLARMADSTTLLVLGSLGQSERPPGEGAVMASVLRAARLGSVVSQAAQRTAAHVVIVPVRQDTNYPNNRQEQEEKQKSARSGQSAHHRSAEYVRLP